MAMAKAPSPQDELSSWTCSDTENFSAEEYDIPVFFSFINPRILSNSLKSEFINPHNHLDSIYCLQFPLSNFESMSKPLDGKVAVVTGGSKGIGRAISLRLAEDGAKVVINYANNTEAAEEVIKLIGSENALAVKADVGNVVEIGRLVDATVQKWGQIDILIPCAGTMIMSELEDVSEADFDSVFNLNVKGPLFLAQKAAPHMAPGSRIVLFSTTQCAASTVTGSYLVYCATKGAIEQITRVLSKDLARKDILVNCVAPGPTGTDMFYKDKSEQLLKTIASFSPQNRIGTPDEIARVVLFLSGPACSWITGQLIRVNGEGVPTALD
ncbi:hypothetical protein B7494_g6935 [Chlorociboria aeruginascens]|nr:hypothetical protein B7494_g6935 [Chlorociboria aeruginascens]